MSNGDDTRLVEQEGIGQFITLSAQFRGLVRLTDTHDKGIDAELEIPYFAGKKTPILGIQIKSRSEAKTLKNGDFSIRVTDQNIDYWSKYGRPVLLVLFDKSSKTMYWQRVEKTTKQQIHVNHQNTYEESSISKFIGFCNDYNIIFSKKNRLIECEPLLAGIAETYEELAAPVVDKLQKFYKHYERGELSDAANLIYMLAGIHDKSRDMLTNAALTYCRLKNIEALDYIEKLIKLGQLNAQQLGFVAFVYSEFRKYKQATSYYEESLKNTYNKETQNNYALACFHLGDFEKAEELFVFLLNDGQPDKAVSFNHALLMTKIGKYKQAIDSYNKAIEISPDLCDAYNNLALLYKALGYHQEALIVFDIGVKSCVRNFALYFNYANLLKDYDKNEDALNLLLQAVDERDEVAAWRDIAIIYCRMGELKKAEKILTENIDAVLPSRSDNTTNAIMDVGFECQYMIKFRYISQKVIDIEVKNCSSNSLFNGLRRVSKEQGVPFEELKKSLLDSDRKNQLDKLTEGSNFINK